MDNDAIETNEPVHSDAGELSQSLSDLRQAGEEPDQALLERVKAHGQEAVGPLIELAVNEQLDNADSESPEVWAPLHAVRLLGELGAAEAIAPLLTLLERVNDEYLAESLPKAFGEIGAPATTPLRAFLFDRRKDVWARIQAAKSLSKIGQGHPETRSEVVSALVARLDPSESQSPEDEMLNAFVIDDLLDLNAVEAAPTIRRAFDEDRVATSIVDLDHALETLELPRALRPARVKATGGLRLRLHCTACGYEREHQIETIYCDLGTMDRREKGEPTPFSEYVIPHRITCPKCGAVDQYRLSNLAYMTLMAEMLKIQAAHELGKPEDETDDGPLRFIRFALADGREMHPFAARDMYRQQVETEPNRPELRVRYANVLRFLNYHKEAVEQYRAALSLAPSNLEAYLNLGQLAQTVGNRLEARQMFESLIEHAPTSRLPLKERQDYVAEATAELVALSGRAIHVSAPERQVQPKRWERAPGRAPRIAPSRSLAPGAHKVGRNDPCPCGSGKKYKKCHGR